MGDLSLICFFICDDSEFSLKIFYIGGPVPLGEVAFQAILALNLSLLYLSSYSLSIIFLLEDDLLCLTEPGVYFELISILLSFSLNDLGDVDIKSELSLFLLPLLNIGVAGRFYFYFLLCLCYSLISS